MRPGADLETISKVFMASRENHGSKATTPVPRLKESPGRGEQESPGGPLSTLAPIAPPCPSSPGTEAAPSLPQEDLVSAV